MWRTSSSRELTRRQCRKASAAISDRMITIESKVRPNDHDEK